MGWFCQNFGFGEIDLAFSLSQQFGVAPADVFALRQSGLGWGEIKHRLAIQPTPTVTATVTVTPTATATPTATPTLTATEPVTPTATPTLTPTPGTQPTAANCTGANPQPKGKSLATQYGVPYQEIMGWFCQGYGFGEIDQAYGLSGQSGQPVTHIFELRKSGLGWGEIKKQVGQGGGKPPKKP